MKRFYVCSMLLLALMPAARAATPADPQQVAATLKDYFFDASRKGNLLMLQEFITAGYPLDTRAEKGYTALILAAYHGHAPAVRLLMQAGADPCARDERGNIALTGAIFKGELTVVRTLLGAPCQVDQPNKAGQTAAMYAALFNRTEILKALADKGANMDASDNAGNSPNSLRAEAR